MTDQVAPGTRSPLVVLVALLVGLGLARAAARVAGLAVLLGVVLASVGALTFGVLLLRVLVLR